MNRFLAVSLLLVTSVLAGCATQPSPEMRPYTAEETKQLALEALGRRGLSFDDYQRQRAALLGQPKPFGALAGGAEGNRTPDLVIANDALYQLSYGPAPASPL